jgi:hypothetical protein
VGWSRWPVEWVWPEWIGVGGGVEWGEAGGQSCELEWSGLVMVVEWVVEWSGGQNVFGGWRRLTKFYDSVMFTLPNRHPPKKAPPSMRGPFKRALRVSPIV